MSAAPLDDFALPSLALLDAVARPLAPAARVGVCVATRGRPAEVARLVGRLREQTLRPEAIVVACVSRSDVGGLADDDEVQIVAGPAGLARQRNRALAALPDACEFAVFFDDDFWPRRDWLAEVVAAFRADPTLACITGNVVADGILGPGLTYAEAERAVDGDPDAAADLADRRLQPLRLQHGLPPQRDRRSAF